MTAPSHLPSRSRFLEVFGLRLHVREWRTHGATDSAPALVLLHGWMDVSASFQFVVDALRSPWRIYAIDSRGFGLSGWSTRGPGTAGYWYPDYLVDLERSLDILLPDQPVNLVGHSMGGNIACIYAGVRPRRVAHLVSIEGVGLPATHAEQAPMRYAQWLDALKSVEPLRTYADVDGVIERLRKNNPRLSSERAAFLAEHWSAIDDDGRRKVLGDPAHKLPNPVLYRVDEAIACWRRIEAPVLWIEAAQTDLYRLWTRGDATKTAALKTEFESRLAAFKHLHRLVIDDAGHMLHHDQPERVAQAIEAFVVRDRVDAHARD